MALFDTLFGSERTNRDIIDDKGKYLFYSNLVTKAAKMTNES
jgi:hypothetical protein